jgi:hypothetical protein
LGSTFSGADSTGLTGNSTFDTILDTGSFANGTTIFTIGGLVTGTNYLVQFFVADTRTIVGVNTRTVTYSDGTNSLTSGPTGSGFVFTGTFTATGATQNVTISGSGPSGENVPYINAWQLRNVSIPEPATLCIWAGLGLVVASGACNRRRTKAAN